MVLVLSYLFTPFIKEVHDFLSDELNLAARRRYTFWKVGNPLHPFEYTPARYPE